MSKWTTERQNRVFTGTLPDGTPVKVELYADGGGDVAFREGEGRFARWGLPTELSEETA